jgi:neutral ceramidase
MQRLLAIALCVSLSLCVSRSPAQEPKPGVWKAGVAKINITPEKLMWMSGYAARKGPAEGKLTDLWAKALVLEDPQGRRGVLVTLDLVGIDRDLSVAVCKAIQEKHGLSRPGIILASSHTHTGPVVRGNLMVMYNLDQEQQDRVTEYGKSLPGKLVQVVGAALRDLRPAKLSWAIGEATFAVNRRNNKEAEVPKLREAGQLKGPVDHDVPVLAVRDDKDKLRAIVFGYACHATVLGLNLWSGDYPGYAQIELEKAYPGALALFWAGCGADQNPLPRRTVALAQKYGKELADSVTAVLDKPMKPLTPRLTMSYVEIDLPFADLPTREQLVRDTLSDNRYIANRGKLLLERMQKEGSLKGNYPYPVQVWKLGAELNWITLGGEVVVDYALRLKKEVEPVKTWVTGYANDVMAYIPSLRVLKEGGYEGGGAMVYYGQPTVWSPRVEETIVDAVHKHVRRLRLAESERERP